MYRRIIVNGPAVEGVNVGGVSPSGYLSRCFSSASWRILADKPPWRNFCKSRRKIKLSRLQYLSRAEVTNLADELEFICQDEVVKVASKNCDKFITPTVRVMFRPVYCQGSHQIVNQLCLFLSSKFVVSD
jgi:hypothetical protein